MSELEVKEHVVDGEDWHTVTDKHGISGVLRGKFRYRKQDKTFEPGEFYAIVFFPKIKALGRAGLFKHTLVETLSCSPEAAIAKFMDRGRGADDKWELYADAGWKVRRIRVSDLGEPTPARQKASAA